MALAVGVAKFGELVAVSLFLGSPGSENLPFVCGIVIALLVQDSFCWQRAATSWTQPGLMSLPAVDPSRSRISSSPNRPTLRRRSMSLSTPNEHRAQEAKKGGAGEHPSSVRRERVPVSSGKLGALESHNS